MRAGSSGFALRTFLTRIALLALVAVFAGLSGVAFLTRVALVPFFAFLAGVAFERFELFRRKVVKRKVFTVRAGFSRFALVALLAFQGFLLLFREIDANHPDVKRVPLFVGRRLDRNNDSVGAANLRNALSSRRLHDVKPRPNGNANRRLDGAVQRLKGYMVARIKCFRVKGCGIRSAVVTVPEPAPLDRVNDRFRRNGRAVIVSAAGAVG